MTFFLDDADRELIESLSADPQPAELGTFYEDEIPEGLTSNGFDLLMDLCRYRILVYRGQGLDHFAEPYRRVWEWANSVELSWVGFDRAPPSFWREQPYGNF